MNQDIKQVVSSALDLKPEPIGNAYKTIIYELGETGHRSEYLSFLMKYILKHPELHNKYTFILNEKIKVRMGSLIDCSAYDIKYIELTNHFSDSIRRSIGEWKQVENLLSSNSNYKRIIFLDIDPYLFLLATDLFKRHHLAVEGILFEPYYHYKEISRGVWFYIRHTLKSYFLQRCATYFNPKLEKLYILNDRKCIPIMNNSVKEVFYFLPDPIDNEDFFLEPELIEQIKTTYSIHPEKTNLLVFGSIDCRKNLGNIIQSLLLLPDHVKQDIHLIIAGKFKAEIKATYLDYIKIGQSKLSISFYDMFINNKEKEILFRYSDIILMPYINFYSSSGILGHAVKHRKRVIVSKDGLVKRLVTENKIGLAVDPLNPKSIMDAIYYMLCNKREFIYDNRKLMQDFDSENFCQTLLLAPRGTRLTK